MTIDLNATQLTSWIAAREAWRVANATADSDFQSYSDARADTQAAQAALDVAVRADAAASTTQTRRAVVERFDELESAMQVSDAADATYRASNDALDTAVATLRTARAAWKAYYDANR